MTLIPNWRRSWRMASVQAAGLSVAFGALPEAVQSSLLDLVGVPASRVPAILGLLVIAGRVIAQPKVGGGQQ